MISFLRKSIFFFVVIGIGMVLPVYAGTQIDNSKSLFNDDSGNGGAEKINVIGTDKQQKDAFINVVKGAVNRVLGILALIALIILLYGGFLMVTSAGDEEQYKKGFTILKHASIGLLLIGVARFIVSLIFWIVNKTSGAAEGSSAETEK